MANLWVVRAEGGKYTNSFLKGGYIGINYGITEDLSKVAAAEDIEKIYRASHPQEESNIVVGNIVGQIKRFLFDIAPGDYVITPESTTDKLYYAKVAGDSKYYFAGVNDGCPLVHRRKVEWAKKPLLRTEFSVPFQNTIRSLQTVFSVSQVDEFLVAIGEKAYETSHHYDPYRVVLGQVLELSPKEFEILVGHLLTALGFEGSEVVGRPGDGGVDATGVLNASNLAEIKIFVQAKRYKLDSKISASVVKELRSAIPFGGQGAFITTADFQKGALDVAQAPGFSRIGLINGNQLVDLLVEHWSDIPAEFQERLGLKPGLVRA